MKNQEDINLWKQGWLGVGDIGLEGESIVGLEGLLNELKQEQY